MSEEEEPEGFLARAAVAARRLEAQRADQDAVEEPKSVFGPVSIAIFAMACAGMLFVGFEVGRVQEIERHKAPEFVPGSLRERLGTPSTLKAQNVPGKQLSRAKHRPSVAPALLAFKALGYATILTCSTATATAILIKWYYKIESVEDLIWRLKRNVPEKSNALKSVVGPPLERMRDGLQRFFGQFRPMIAPDDENLAESTEKEKAELVRFGIEPSVLDSVANEQGYEETNNVQNEIVSAKSEKSDQQ